MNRNMITVLEKERNGFNMMDLYDLNEELCYGVQEDNFKTLGIIFICFVDVGFKFEGLQNRCLIRCPFLIWLIVSSISCQPAFLID